MPVSATKLRRRLERIRADLTWADETLWFYNLDNYRSDRQVAAELHALASTRPAIIGVCEVTGNRLPKLAGYTLVRDTSTASRVNIAAYVRDDLPVRNPRWLDMKGSWPRTERRGTHEPRSFLVLQIGRMQVIVAHQAPKNARNAAQLQLEGIDALDGTMSPRRSKRLPWAARAISRLRPRIVVWDSNRRSGETPGPDQLAERIGGVVHGGGRIDNAVTRGGIEVLRIKKHAQVAGVDLESDHGGAIQLHWRVRSYWLK